ncbi:hypothetical protein [Burkholderia sp. Ac-20349]|uniref:hypothetical protein n=1 Tax=Burkholderia sp. Ac-20349 TaxID=2703893 RepID=UPI00197B75D3|nr:hypothetical protein [Burkholderia sp. Ac-20349]MBN3838268.1 hypothetical protein [Burkholderia sp. Ac-20349]
MGDGYSVAQVDAGRVPRMSAIDWKSDALRERRAQWETRLPVWMRRRIGDRFYWLHEDIQCDSSQASSLTTVKNNDVQIDYDGRLCRQQVPCGAAFGRTSAWHAPCVI